MLFERTLKNWQETGLIYTACIAKKSENKKMKNRWAEEHVQAESAKAVRTIPGVHVGEDSWKK